MVSCHRMGHNHCSGPFVRVTDNQTPRRAPPVRGQNSFRPLTNYGVMSGVLVHGAKVISEGSIWGFPQTPEGSIMSSSGARLILMFLAPAVVGLGVTACTHSASPPPQTQGFTAKTPSRESAPPSSAPTSIATATAPASSPTSMASRWRSGQMRR